MTEADGRLAISNFRAFVIEQTEAANTGKNGNQHITGKPAGAGVGFIQTVEDFAEMYGDGVTGEVLERVRARMDLRALYLYYDARIGSEVEDLQEQAESEFQYFMEEILQELLETAEEQEAAEEPEPEDFEDYYEEEPAEEPEPARPAKEAKPKQRRKIIDMFTGLPRKVLEEEYRKARRRLQDAINRRKKAGVDVKIEIPSIPKNITAGSIRRINKVLQTVQKEYKYLAWKRGYASGRR